MVAAVLACVFLVVGVLAWIFLMAGHFVGVLLEAGVPACVFMAEVSIRAGVFGLCLFLEIPDGWILSRNLNLGRNSGWSVD